MIVGLTGGIASGKSLVADFFRELGVPVIDTDEIARYVVTPGHPAWRLLYAAFGADYFLPDGQLDRAALARLVFADPSARGTLESITHPAIFAEVDRRIAELRHSPCPPDVIVVAVPLLYEVGAEDRFDAIVVVYAPVAQMRERMIRKRGMSPDAADARIAAQLPIDEKIGRADYLLDNSRDPEWTQTQVQELLRQLRRRAQSSE